jgi:hypothetical protein
LWFLWTTHEAQDCIQWFDVGTDCGRYALSELAIIDSNAFEKIMEVANLYADGVTSPYTIARRLNIKVVEAKAAIEQWHEMIRTDIDSSDVAKDALNVMLQRYDKLLEEANKNLKDLQGLAFDEKVSAQINATLKNIADFDAKRVDLLQKAGLLDAHELGDELAEREEREAMIIGILQHDLCDDCKEVVRDKLTRLTGQVQGTVIEGETV